jgi:hypothetical protein
MSKAFGTKFILVNDIQQILPPTLFGGGPWLHLATVVRGFKEYCCFKNQTTHKVYIEEVDPSSKYLFKRIEDESEFQDLRRFLEQKAILAVATGKEIKIAKKK